MDSYTLLEQLLMPASVNNTVGASLITPMSSTPPVDKPTSPLAPRVEKAEQGRPADARVADELRNPDRQIWDGPDAVLNVVAQYAEMEQLGALHALSPGFARTLDTTPHRAALAIPQLRQDIKAWEDERGQLNSTFVTLHEQPAQNARITSLNKNIVYAEDAIAVAERRRMGESATTLGEERSARAGLLTAALNIFSELESLGLADAPSVLAVQQATENVKKIFDEIQPRIDTLALRPKSIDGHHAFRLTGVGQLPDSSVEQMQALSDGFDWLMRAPDYLQLDDGLKQFCQHLSEQQKFELDVKRRSI
jgi:hypothetical protein